MGFKAASVGLMKQSNAVLASGAKKAWLLLCWSYYCNCYRFAVMFGVQAQREKGLEINDRHQFSVVNGAGGRRAT